MASDQSPAEERAALPGEEESIWLASSETTDYAPLAGGLTVDTAVVGGGIAGITTAARLVDAGQDVALLEADRILNGVTGHTTAKLTSLHGLIYDHVRSTFGEREARLYGEANETAIDYVEDQVEERDLDCEFERAPAYTYVDDDGRRAAVEREAMAAKHLGLPATYTESTPLSSDVAGAVRFDDQARFDPVTYLRSQAERVAADGHLFERTRATDLDPGSPVEVETERGTVAADQVVVATHFPLYDHGLYFARMKPKRGYLLAVRLDGPVPEGLHYRPGEPYFSVRPHPTGDESLALVGGQNHRTGHAGDGFERYRKLEREARHHLDVESVEYRWSTQDYSSVDKVPFVGQLAPQTDDVYVATGFGGWGMSNGVAAGLLLSDLVRGVDNEWQEVFTPTRLKPGAAARDLLEHNLHTAKDFVEDRLPSPADDTPRLERGEGTVVQEGTGAVGRYRDEEGETHVVSAVCPHMGCILDWNGAERTWDCSCHGSRFEYDGAVIDGPAMTDLDALDSRD